MPKQGNSVESCIIVDWKKQVGQSVAPGDILCEVETDKALLEVESPAAGTLLALFFQGGDDVPVLTNIAAIGQPGENIEALRPGGASVAAPALAPAVVEAAPAPVPAVAAPTPVVVADSGPLKISPRAKNLAERKQVDASAASGTGPGGRIIERDVQAMIETAPAMTPLVKTMLASGDYQAPAKGSGVSGRIMSTDLTPVAAPAPAVVAPAPSAEEEQITVIPVRGIRKVIASRMLESLQTTAQLTLNASADARTMMAYRQQLKESDAELGLQKVTVNDLILFTLARTLPQYPDLNALFDGSAVSQYAEVHLGFAVDTPRGLMVPVIRRANRLSLKQISAEARRLAAACMAGTITPDEMSGGTFTLTNLGSLGIESFTPVLNPPQVGILGVGNINLKPVQGEAGVEFIPHLNLSLTINHQVVDGAPAARFLQSVSKGLAGIQLLLAL
jgi:pyruvate dehydrogenase E2 component (dihydrolipoamide acetyltransferase)